METRHGIAFAKLKRFAQIPESARKNHDRLSASAAEKCDLCAQAVVPGHEHLIEARSRKILCACGACAMLLSAPGNFSAQSSSPKKYLRIPKDRQYLGTLNISDSLWSALGVPVGIAFFFKSESQVFSFYPSPAGAVQSLVENEAWAAVEEAIPSLKELASDVEALLVNTHEGRREYFQVPIDTCFELVGILRAGWTGFSGGDTLWPKIERFFSSLRLAHEF